tara:strand:- start:71 stop:409 length:339 start_codon:yes stop_codon:yes gene_type:complete
MTTTVSDLPMEVWSQVAVYVPFSDRLRTFHALCDAGCLPDTYTNASNAFLQFCSEADCVERECADERTSELLGTEENVRVLVAMGFNDDEVRIALRLTNGALEEAMDHLLAT